MSNQCTDLQCVEALRGFLAAEKIDKLTVFRLLLKDGLEPSAISNAMAIFENPPDAEGVGPYDAIIDQARADYTDDECEIDDNPLLSPAADGCWVAAWVWVANDLDELDEELETD